MTTLQERPTADASPNDLASRRMRNEMAACRVRFTWFGTTRSLTEAQRAAAARTLGADHQLLSAGKRLLNTKHPAFRRVNSIRNRVLNYWKGETLPFPLPGTRLIRHDAIDVFNQRMMSFDAELSQAVSALEDEYDELKLAARERLGDLFNLSDYPGSLDGLFSVSWDFPNVEVPDYLRRLKPELYRQEAARVARRFDEALEMAEQAFVEELQDLIDHLVERLSGSDGKPKIFRDSAVSNLSEFFDRFRRLNVRSSEELENLVESCEQVIQGNTPQSLRSNASVRETVATDLRQITHRIDDWMVDRPRRQLIRKGR